MTHETIAILIGITIISALIVLGIYQFDRATKRVEALIINDQKQSNITIKMKV